MVPLVSAPDLVPERGLFSQSLTLDVDEARLRTALLTVLELWAKCPDSRSTFGFVVREEKERDGFALLYAENDKAQEPFVMADFEIRDGKIWLIQNNTDIDFGIELTEQGVTRQEIVLGFLSPAQRRDSGYSD